MFFLVIFIVSLFARLAIGIDISKCPPLRLPTNGYVVCDHLIGAFCAPVCNPGFVYESQPAQAYVCNPMRKAWATYPGGYPLPWPNCIKSSVDKRTAKYATATKKSLVDQQGTSVPDQSGPSSGRESLWQRMLMLTSQLTQSKMREVAAGAARSLQTPGGGSVLNGDGSTANSVGSSNNNMNPSDQSGQFSPYQSDVTPTQSGDEKRVEFRRLQQYWDEYYKRYYASIGKGKLPDWMMRSPWSNDPERVQGALDTDMYNTASLQDNKTADQNWNSYVQSYYKQFPRPDANATEAALENATRPPNSSSDAFIENVIENDLESKKVMEKNLNADLYYEDQLIHNEERTRPRVNLTRYVPTTRPNSSTTTTLSTSLANSTNSYEAAAYPYSSTQNGSRNSSAFSGTATKQDGGNLQKNSPTELKNTKTSSKGYYAASENNQVNNASATASPQDQASSSDPYENYTQYYKEYYKKIQNSSTADNQTQSKGSGAADIVTPKTANGRNTSTGPSADSNQADGYGGAVSSLKKPRLSKLLQPASKDDVADRGEAAYDEDPEDDDTDYLDQLDISALVKELIKLETIRKEKKLSRRKHLQRQHSREVASFLAGDVLRGYFKTRQAPAQKGLKKHLLRVWKRRGKFKPNESPLPKFNR